MKTMKKAILACICTLYMQNAYASVISVPSGGDLQAAINAAQPGDEIVLAPGGRYVGQFKLPVKAGVVTIRTASVQQLPNGRVSPSDAALMPTIASGLPSHALECHGCTNWKIDGVRFEGNTEGYGEVISIQNGQNVTLDRILLVIPDPQQQKRGVLGNGRNITLSRSHLAGIWRAGQDSQAFVAWDGAGPYKILDNYLEAASENVMFGGADATTAEDIPADILVEGNHFSKRLIWKGQPRVVKNLFELKSAKRVTVRNNLFEHHWVDAQPGPAIVFTPRNQDGKAPWSVIEDVLFERNVVMDVPTVFNILGYDNFAASGQTTRITIRHNLLLGSGGGRMAIIGNEVGTLTFDHNTYIQPQTGSSSMIQLYAEGNVVPAGQVARPATFAIQTLVFTNNLLQANTYGLFSSSGGGNTALTAFVKAVTWQQNVLAGGSGAYPATTTFLPAAEYPSQFTPEFLLVSTSPFKGKATDATDLGWGGRQVTVPTQPEPEPQPTPPSNLTLSAVLSASTCKLVVSALPPDLSGGWSAQFKRGTTNIGTVDTSAPFQRTTTVKVGVYQVTVVWTKAGQSSKTSDPLTVICE